MQRWQSAKPPSWHCKPGHLLKGDALGAPHTCVRHPTLVMNCKVSPHGLHGTSGWEEGRTTKSTDERGVLWVFGPTPAKPTESTFAPCPFVPRTSAFLAVRAP